MVTIEMSTTVAFYSSVVCLIEGLLVNHTTVRVNIGVIESLLNLMLVIISIVKLGLSHMLLMIPDGALCVFTIALERLLLFHFLMRSIMMGRGSLVVKDFLLGNFGFIKLVVMHIFMELIMM